MSVSGYDVNNGSATTLPVVELWNGKNIFTAQHNYVRLYVYCIYGTFNFQIQVILFNQDNSLNLKVFFFFWVRNEWLRRTRARRCLKHLKHTFLGASGPENWTVQIGWDPCLHLSAASSCSSCCLHLSSEFRWWWHDFPWLPQGPRCYVTSRFPILLKVFKQKTQGVLRTITVKDQNKKPAKKSCWHCGLHLFFSFFGMLVCNYSVQPTKCR